MGLTKETGQKLKEYILNNVDKYPSQIVAKAAKEFGISRQAVHRHIRQLKNNSALVSAGKGKSVQYSLKIIQHTFQLKVFPGMSEDQVWKEKIFPSLPKLNKNILDICQYGFTEIFNNVIDHSESEEAIVVVTEDITSILLYVSDSGVGIFNKIQQALKLEDPQHAILELAKGKFTTDPEQHSGEGIFFTSRIFDKFEILSQNLYFYGYKDEDWILESENGLSKGTAVFMKIRRDSKTTIKEIFDKYTSGESDFGFSKTIIPVSLMRHEGQELVSRSQAKRLITRFDRFKEVVLDFQGVTMIGQAFADELFRVFGKQHPEVSIVPINTTEDIKNIILHVRAESGATDLQKENSGEN
ncbi:MAG: DUF4325 domain-containing protein [Candidatus Omnitrophica bacterium]|nr:DUF4325 domain-containing protein [Candidatus Omnitrophota bacterium]